MVLLYIYGVPWIPSIYPLYVSIYTSTMDPMGYEKWWCSIVFLYVYQAVTWIKMDHLVGKTMPFWPPISGNGLSIPPMKMVMWLRDGAFSLWHCFTHINDPGVSENVVYPIVPNGFADHYPVFKWLAIIGKINPTFSDKPIHKWWDFSWICHRLPPMTSGHRRVLADVIAWSRQWASSTATKIWA